MTRLVDVYRGNRVESSHLGAVAVVDSAGVLRAYAGAPDLSTFLRSAAKPFQTLALLSIDGAEEYDLSQEEIATITASHGGEPRHVATAAALLRKGDFDEGDLLCGTHPPFDSATARELKLAGEEPGPLHNNCSGKHAGMLLGARLLDLPTGDYIASDHPMQRRAAELLAAYAGLPGESIDSAIDGCGVPTWYLSLYRTALAYARLAATAFGVEGSMPGHAEHASDVFRSMAGSAGFVAGSWSITSPLMEAFGGTLIAKDGAEGFYAMAITPDRADDLPALAGQSSGRALGIAIKVLDGSMSRGRDPVILRTLESLGCHETRDPAFESYRRRTIRNVAGREAGHTEAAFELTIP